MAVALEVGLGSAELGGGGSFAHMSKKRAWGDDQQKLLEMMMGKPFDEVGNAGAARHTLDLLGSGSSTVTSDHSEFLELGQDAPLPSGWEKRLDLASGTVFFTNWTTGRSTYDDPRKLQYSVSSFIPSASASCHMSLELLQSELCKQKSNNNPVVELDNGKKSAWSMSKEIDAGNDQKLASCKDGLDLKLNLSSKRQSNTKLHTIDEGVVPSESSERPSECLWLLPPSSSSMSSSHRAVAADGTEAVERVVVCAENGNAVAKEAMVTLTGCKRCLMYVMISPSDPRCPKCGSSLIVDFPMPKKTRFDLGL